MILESNRSKRGITLTLAVIVFAAGFLPHLSNLKDPFYGDDWVHLAASKHLSLEALKSLMWPTGTELLYRPVSALYFWANYELFGLSAMHQRIVKLALFGLCGVAFFCFILCATGRLAMAAVAALVFAMHPLNTVTAVWLATHANCLSMLFGFAALIFFVKARRKRRGWGFLYAGFLAAMLLSFGSMEMFYGLPLIVLATDVLLLRQDAGRKPGWRSLLRWHLPHFCLAAAFFAIRFHEGMPLYLARNIEARTWSLLLAPVQYIPAAFLAPDWHSASLLDNAVPLAVGAVFVALMAWTIARAPRPALRLVLFSAIWYAAMVIPVIRLIPATYPLPMDSARHLFAISAAVCLLVGSSTLCLDGGRLRRVALGAGMVPLLAALALADGEAGKAWQGAWHDSQAIIDRVFETCRGEEWPVRLVFLNYPQSTSAKRHLDAPSYALVALAATNALRNEDTRILPTAYTLFDPENYPDKQKEQIIRFFPVMLGGVVEYLDFHADYPEMYVVHGEDLSRTFFFYWNASERKCVDCTDAMRERLSTARGGRLFEWHAGEWDRANPVKGPVIPRLSGCSALNGLIYLAPIPNSDAPPYLEVILPDIRCDQVDQVEVKLSVASKSDMKGTCTVKLVWLLDDENEGPALRNRSEDIQTEYYTYHANLSLHFSLAQWFLDKKYRYIKKIYIFLPRNVSETAIESITLTRLKVE